MTASEWASFWWNNITGPNAVVMNTVDLLREKKTVVLNVPGDLPWRHVMRGAIEAIYKERSGYDDTIIETIDAADECAGGSGVSEYLLERFAPVSVRSGYRPRPGVSIQDYMIRNGVLKDRIIWVKGLDAKTAAPWLDFCKSYNVTSLKEGLFVLEVHGESQVTESRRIKIIDYSGTVTPFDVQTFCSFFLSQQTKYDDRWKTYIAVLTANLCGTDAEVAETFLRGTDFVHQEPLDAIGQIVSSGKFAARGNDVDSVHVLALYRAGKIPELQNRVWMAQVQVLFPLVEFQRVQIIGALSDQLSECLQEEEVMQYKNRLEDPLDVELGTLVYLLAHIKENGKYSVYVPDPKMREQIHFFHKCRNQLAHVRCCEPEDVKRLLEC